MAKPSSQIFSPDSGVASTHQQRPMATVQCRSIKGLLLPKRPVSILRGLVKARPRRVSIEEMGEAAAAGGAANALPRRR
jgi:hypothetical protein